MAVTVVPAEYENQRCGNCRHWHRIVNPANLAERNGECRQGPPSVTVLPGPQGQMFLTAYSRMHDQFPACSKIELRVPVGVNGECDHGQD